MLNLQGREKAAIPRRVPHKKNCREVTFLYSINSRECRLVLRDSFLYILDKVIR